MWSKSLDTASACEQSCNGSEQCRSCYFLGEDFWHAACRIWMQVTQFSITLFVLSGLKAVGRLGCHYNQRIISLLLIWQLLWTVVLIRVRLKDFQRVHGDPEDCCFWEVEILNVGRIASHNLDIKHRCCSTWSCEMVGGGEKYSLRPKIYIHFFSGSPGCPEMYSTLRELRPHYLKKLFYWSHWL